MNSVSSASAGRARGAGGEGCQRIGSVDHQGRRSPGDVYNRPGHYACESPRIVRTSDRHRTVARRAGELAGVAGLLAVTIVLNVAVSALVVALIPAAARRCRPLELLVSTVVPLLWFQVAFSLANKPERFVQTMTALFGVNTLFQPLVAPLPPRCCRTCRSQDPTMPPPAALSLLFARDRASGR